MASIRTRKSADGTPTCYRVEWRTGGARTGAWDSETFSVRNFTGRQAAQRAAKLFKAEIEANGHRRLPQARAKAKPGKPGRYTVSDLVRDYIDDRARRVRSDRTISDYRRAAELWVNPSVGRTPADVLTQGDVQEWVDGIPRSAKTVANLHGILSAAYQWGQRTGKVTADPCAATELPHRHKGVPRGLHAGEWAILHQAAADVSPDAADLLLFLVGTGWRWSEATALQVLACELDRPDPYVEVSRVWRRRADGTQELVEDAKSEAGLRRVRVSPMLAQMLKRRVTGKALGDFVFPGARGGQLRHSHFHQRVWKPIVELAQSRGLRAKPTIHWLRHTQANLAIDSGASLPALQRRLGHESIQTTVDTYGRLVDDVGSDVLDAIDAALFRRAGLRAVGDEA